jgi:hypothetical protein
MSIFGKIISAIASIFGGNGKGHGNDKPHPTPAPKPRPVPQPEPAPAPEPVPAPAPAPDYVGPALLAYLYRDDASIDHTLVVNAGPWLQSALDAKQVNYDDAGDVRMDPDFAEAYDPAVASEGAAWLVNLIDTLDDNGWTPARAAWVVSNQAALQSAVEARAISSVLRQALVAAL